ncbi:MAG TPA: ATP synthase F1 subunit delta [Tepidisphaeraceae bacterium]|jgi:F-type H+-transporting ATPase subunit delta|nr:ATP synthase F1 subunit delta [Tepidisphaeraceae bacterium]
MAKTPHKSPLALAYAQSLLELAQERNQAEPIGQELSQIREVIEQNKTFGLFLADPAIGEIERGETIKRIFRGRLNPLLMNFLGVVNQKGRLGSLTAISEAYDGLLDELLGKIEVDVTVAHRLSDQQLEEVRKTVSAALKKDAVMHQYVDEKIIGGLVLRVQDRLLDGSVKAQLDALHRQMLTAKTK